jgi:hypothetical protein
VDSMPSNTINATSVPSKTVSQYAFQTTLRPSQIQSYPNAVPNVCKQGTED